MVSRQLQAKLFLHYSSRCSFSLSGVSVVKSTRGAVVSGVVVGGGLSVAAVALHVNHPSSFGASVTTTDTVDKQGVAGSLGPPPSPTLLPTLLPFHIPCTTLSYTLLHHVVHTAATHYIYSAESCDYCQCSSGSSNL